PIVHRRSFWSAGYGGNSAGHRPTFSGPATKVGLYERGCRNSRSHFPNVLTRLCPRRLAYCCNERCLGSVVPVRQSSRPRFPKSYEQRPNACSSPGSLVVSSGYCLCVYCLGALHKDDPRGNCTPKHLRCQPRSVGRRPETD